MMDYKKFKCLIIDDSRAATLMIKKSLKQLGMTQIHIATNQQDALDSINADCPDVAFIDLIMPSVSGFEIAELLKKEHPQIHLIMISATDTEENMSELKRHKLPFFLVKPINKEELEGILLVLDTLDFFG